MQDTSLNNAATNIVDQLAKAGAITMPFDKAFSFATGSKVVYLSACTPRAEADSPIRRVDGVTYIDPNVGDGKHYIEAKIVRPDLVQENFQTPSFMTEPTNFDSSLPLVMKLKDAQKPITSLTDEEIHNAGYRSANKCRIMLALQSEQAPLMKQMIVAHMQPMLAEVQGALEQGAQVQTDDGASVSTPIPPQEQSMILNQLVAATFETLKKDIDPKALGNPMLAQFIPQIIPVLVNSIEKEKIPGEVDTFTMRMATPQEMVTCNDCPDMKMAEQKAGKTLRYLHDTVTAPPTPNLKPLRDYMRQKYGETQLGAMLKELKTQADLLDPLPPKERSPREELRARVDEAFVAGRLTEGRAAELGFLIESARGDKALQEAGRRLEAAIHPRSLEIG